MARIHFTPEERLAMVQKWFELKRQGMSMTRAAEEMGTTQMTLKNWVKNHNRDLKIITNQPPKRVDFSTGTPRPLNDLSEDDQVVVTLIQGTSTNVARTLSKIFENRAQ